MDLYLHSLPDWCGIFIPGFEKRFFEEIRREKLATGTCREQMMTAFNKDWGNVSEYLQYEQKYGYNFG